MYSNWLPFGISKSYQVRRESNIQRGIETDIQRTFAFSAFHFSIAQYIIWQYKFPFVIDSFHRNGKW